MSESAETIPSLARIVHGVNGIPVRHYGISLQSNSVYATDEVQTITLQDYKSKQEVVNSAYNTYFKQREVQRIYINEPRTTQTIDIEASAGSLASVNEVQTVTITEGRARQIVKVANAGLAGENQNEKQTITISEPRAKQVVKVANAGLAGENQNEIQTITISEPRAKQVVKVANAGLAGENQMKYKQLLYQSQGQNK